MGERKGERRGLPPKRLDSSAKSLGDCRGGALVDASAAVDALAGIDDSDVIAGDSSLRADVDACSACNTLRSVNCNHMITSASTTLKAYKKLIRICFGDANSEHYLLGYPQHRNADFSAVWLCAITAILTPLVTDLLLWHSENHLPPRSLAGAALRCRQDAAKMPFIHLMEWVRR